MHCNKSKENEGKLKCGTFIIRKTPVVERVPFVVGEKVLGNLGNFLSLSRRYVFVDSADK